MKRRVEIRIAGIGGQGAVLAGEILGRAAVLNGKYAVQTASYGAEARGGLAKSDVIISDGKVDFPLVRKCDVLVAMAQQALNAHLKDLREGGLLIVDEGLVKEVPKADVKVLKAPATKASKEALGSELYANVVMLGVLTRATGLVSVESVDEAIAKSVPASMKEANVKAFKIGLNLAQRMTT